MVNKICNLINRNDMKMKTVFRLILLFQLCCFFSSCIKDNDEKKEKIEIVTMYVSPETKFMKFLDEIPVECMIVTVLKEQSYLPLGWIDGFEFEKGYEYRLKVKKTTPVHPMQDAPESFYSLIEILSKEKL